MKEKDRKRGSKRMKEKDRKRGSKRMKAKENGSKDKLTPK